MGVEALVDMDIVCYRVACTCEEDDTPDIAFFRVNELMERIISSVNATSFTCYLSGGDNFRKQIDPQYKANRKDKVKPRWLEACKEYAVTSWNAKVTDGIEADDALGIAQREDTYICSIDKDLLQIPGMHYNFVKNEEYYIRPEEGLRRFWTQTIVGDTSDNVFGIKGLGPKRTAPIIEAVEGETFEELNVNLYNTVRALYADDRRLHSNCKLLWVMRKEGEVWQPPTKSGQQGELNLSSPASYEVEAEDGLQSMSA